MCAGVLAMALSQITECGRGTSWLSWAWCPGLGRTEAQSRWVKGGGEGSCMIWWLEVWGCWGRVPALDLFGVSGE